MKVLEKERIYSDAQRKNARQSELDLALKSLHTYCSELEMAKRNLNKQVQQNTIKIIIFCEKVCDVYVPAVSHIFFHFNIIFTEYYVLSSIILFLLTQDNMVRHYIILNEMKLYHISYFRLYQIFFMM